MFTVMGITGNVGGAVAENLLAAGKTVRGVVRNPEKAKVWPDRGVELVPSAYDDAAGLAKAFAGAEGVFSMIPPDFAPAPGLPDQKRTIAAIREALERAKPGKAVFLSSIGSEQPSGLGLITSTHLMEQATRTLPIPVAYLRAGSFMENWLGALDHICATGEMPFFYAPLERKFSTGGHAGYRSGWCQGATGKLDGRARARGGRSGRWNRFVRNGGRVRQGVGPRSEGRTVA
jgi:NAD(P)H dehydrogenase (quinone)